MDRTRGSPAITIGKKAGKIWQNLANGCSSPPNMLQVMNHSHILKKHQNHLTFTRFHGDLCTLHFELSEPPNALVGTCYSSMQVPAGSRGIHNTGSCDCSMGLGGPWWNHITMILHVLHPSCRCEVRIREKKSCHGTKPRLFFGGCPGQQFSHPNLNL